MLGLSTTFYEDQLLLLTNNMGVKKQQMEQVSVCNPGVENQAQGKISYCRDTISLYEWLCENQGNAGKLQV